MVKPACFDSKGMKKGAWSEEEDEKLRAYVMRYGHWNWRLLPKYAGLKRCGKSCRLRWVNYLKPGVKKGNFTKEEEDLIVKLQRELGNKWSAIATKFPGRTDSEIKNYWYRRIEKRCNKRNPSTKTKFHNNNNNQNQENVSDSNNTSQIESYHSPNESHNDQDYAQSNENNSSSFGSMQEPQPDFSARSSSFSEDIPYQNEYYPPLPEEESFYQQLHFDELSTADSSFLNNNLDWTGVDDQPMVSCGSVEEPVQDSCWTEPFELDAFVNNYQSGENYNYDPLFQYLDQCDRYEEEYREDLWTYSECTLV